MRSLVAGVVLLLLTPTLAHAAKRRVVIVEEEDETPPRHVTLTISPVHLIGPFGELTAETRITASFSLAAIGGIGQMPFASGGTHGLFWDAGGQARYYVSGTFDDGGVLLGAEVLYLHAPSDVDATALAANLSASAMVGYKLVTRVGFTVDSAFGVTGLIVRQHKDGEGRPLQLLGNLGVGWTF